MPTVKITAKKDNLPPIIKIGTKIFKVNHIYLLYKQNKRTALLQINKKKKNKIMQAEKLFSTYLDEK